MKYAPTFLYLLLLAGACQGSIILEASCYSSIVGYDVGQETNSIPLSITPSGGSGSVSCAASDSGGFGRVQAFADIQLEPDRLVSMPASLDVQLTVCCGYLLDIRTTISGFVSAYTPGPVRPGLLTLDVHTSNWDFGSNGSYFSMGAYASDGTTIGTTWFDVPFTLGQPFEIVVSVTNLRFEDALPIWRTGFLAASWQITELDGAPVPLMYGVMPTVETPEPSTWLMLIVGIGLICRRR